MQVKTILNRIQKFKMDNVMKKSVFSFFVLFFAALFFSGCTTEVPEGHIIFFDEEHEKNFKDELDARGMAYKNVGNNEIYYSIDDQKIVDDVRDYLILNYPVSYEIYNESVASIFSKLLTEKGIEYTVYGEPGGGSRFVLENKFLKRSSELLAVARARRTQ